VLCLTSECGARNSLFTACWNGKYGLCKLLIDHGAKVNWRNLRGNTALHMAVEQNQVRIVELLLLSGYTLLASCSLLYISDCRLPYFVPSSAEAPQGLVADIRKKSFKKISSNIDKLFIGTYSPFIIIVSLWPRQFDGHHLCGMLNDRRPFYSNLF
jgi:ankyrin repeat protein